MPLQKIQKTAGLLLEALNSREQRAIEQAQRNFSQAVEEGWRAYQQGRLNIRSGQTLPRSMYLYATRELPQEVAHLRRWSTVAREINNFMRTVKLISSLPQKQ